MTSDCCLGLPPGAYTTAEHKHVLGLPAGAAPGAAAHALGELACRSTTATNSSYEYANAHTQKGCPSRRA